MRTEVVPDTQLPQMSRFIAGAMGLHFPRERWSDLQRGLAGAAQEFGFDDVGACADWLLSSSLTKAQLQVLASHLTIGETYFFRDKQTLAALAEHILPELIRARRGREPRLRLWSAACCTGEEAYTLAILLHQLVPDLADWRLSILATDINPRFLRKAAAGIYGEWSFRDAPAGLKERYFTRTKEGRYAVIPEIRRVVNFGHLNLVEDVYPSPVSDTNALDLIFCRNVLMYFTPAQIEKVIGKLHHALVDGGWLAVGPSEASHTLFSGFGAAHFPGTILYQRSGAAQSTVQRGTPWRFDAAGDIAMFAREASLPQAPPEVPVLPSSAAEPPLQHPRPAETPPDALPDAPSALAAAESLYQQGRYGEAADMLLASFPRRAPCPESFSLLARALANQGKLGDALAWCERWVAADKVDPAGHYLRALILLEQGDPAQARLSLQRVLFLQPEFVLAHFTLGNLARGKGKRAEADRHFANASAALRRYQPDDLLPESDGLSAGRLSEIINAMTAPEGGL